MRPSGELASHFDPTSVQEKGPLNHHDEFIVVVQWWLVVGAVVRTQSLNSSWTLKAFFVFYKILKLFATQLRLVSIASVGEFFVCFIAYYLLFFAFHGA